MNYIDKVLVMQMNIFVITWHYTKLQIFEILRKIFYSKIEKAFVSHRSTDTKDSQI